MMLKNTLITALVAASVSFGMVKFVNKTSENPVVQYDTTHARVLRTGTLRCGWAAWPGVIAKDPNSGRLHGFMVDITEQMAKNLSLKVEWTAETGWGDWVTGLKSGHFDAFCSSSYQNAGLGRDVRFMSPLFYNPVHAYVGKDETRIHPDLGNLDDPQFKASAMDGEVSSVVPAMFFPRMSLISLPQMSTFDQLLLNVSTKKADIVFEEQGIVDEFLKKNPGMLKRLTQKPFQVFASSFAVAIAEDELGQMLDSAIVEMQNNGVIDQILIKNNADPGTYLRVAKPYR